MIRTVYIAGPYSGPDVLGNVKAAIIVAEQVSRLGLFPFIPHLYHYWDQFYPHEYQFWLAQDAVWIARCDALLIYDESPGALKDVAKAKLCNIPVFHSVQELARQVLEQRSWD